MSAFIDLTLFKNGKQIFLNSECIESIYRDIGAEDGSPECTIITIGSGERIYVKELPHDIMVNAGFSPEKE